MQGTYYLNKISTLHYDELSIYNYPIIKNTLINIINN